MIISGVKFLEREIFRLIDHDRLTCIHWPWGDIVYTDPPRLELLTNAPKRFC
jgi:hypothetical protein